MSGPLIPLATVKQYAADAGFKGASLDTIVAIALAETGGTLNPHARNVNTNGSVDRGILQINNEAWPGITDAQADDPKTAFALAYQRISKRGTDFSPWATFKNNAFVRWLTVASSGVQPGSSGLPNPGDIPGAVGGAVGGAVSGAASGIVSGAEQAVSDLVKWLAPHAILVGGAVLALVFLLKQLSGPVVPVPV